MRYFLPDQNIVRFGDNDFNNILQNIQDIKYEINIKEPRKKLLINKFGYDVSLVILQCLPNYGDPFEK